MTILITGGAKNLGKATALELARHGHNLALHYRNSEKEALLTAQECRSLGVEADIIQGDFSDLPSFIERYQKKFPKTKGIINNVGPYFIGPLSETPESKLRDLLETNFITPFRLIQSLLPSLKETKGSIINIGVIGLQKHRANTYASAYHLAKNALLDLTLSYAKEFKQYGIRVNLVSPGLLETSVDKDHFPHEKVISFQEIAKLINYLFDDSSITGQNIEVSAGFGL